MSYASRAASRALTLAKGGQTMPEPKYTRKGNVVKEGDTVLFTGQSKLKDGSVVPNISAAKRFVRQTLKPKYGELRTV